MAKWDLEERRRVLRKKRKEIGLSQAGLASLAGVTQWSVSRFERSAADLKPSTLAKIEVALTDALVGHRTTQLLRAQHSHSGAGTLSKMTAAPRLETEKYWQADVPRDAGMWQLVEDNVRLTEQVTNLNKLILN